jgi:hypothetical protein
MFYQIVDFYRFFQRRFNQLFITGKKKPQNNAVAKYQFGLCFRARLLLISYLELSVYIEQEYLRADKSKISL